MNSERKWTIEQLKNARESEDKVEFKRGEGGDVAYDGGSRTKPNERRKCILGYVTALCNENGGTFVIGMEDSHPHRVVGTRQAMDALGDLEAGIYRDTGIRTNVYDLFEDPVAKTGRVVVIEIPSRPAGKVYKFEDVPLMRVGEELRPMSDEQYRKILQEVEPDFSQQTCEGATLDDLDDEAIRIMREKYATKQKNERFLTLEKEQLLSDLDLVVDGRVTNGAVILVGKESALKRLLPQAAVMLEYRNTEAQINFDNRVVYRKPFFRMIDELWHDINLRNGSFPVREGPYIFDVPYFNEDVVREAVNNAIAHRDYRSASETFVKLYPQSMTILNAGGFPHGVTVENILTVPSTPRNRLLADVLSKTGVVERSGQGVDKIFYNTLIEGKPEPDYSKSDDFKVELTLQAAMKDRGFALFVESVQQTLSDDQKLSVFEVVTLAKIRDGKPMAELDRKYVRKLEGRGLVEKRGRTRGVFYILSRSYYEFTGDLASYSTKSDWNLDQMLALTMPFLVKYKTARMGDFVNLFSGHMTRRQVREYVQKLVGLKILLPEGVGAGTRYKLSEAFRKSDELIGKALEIGLKALQNEIRPNSVQTPPSIEP